MPLSSDLVAAACRTLGQFRFLGEVPRKEIMGSCRQKRVSSTRDERKRLSEKPGVGEEEELGTMSQEFGFALAVNP